MANHIRAWRQRRGLTQERLAELIGVEPQTISKLERGERRLSDHWIAKLCDALDCTETELLRSGPGAVRLPAEEAATGGEMMPAEQQHILHQVLREWAQAQERQAQAIERLAVAIEKIVAERDKATAEPAVAFPPQRRPPRSS